MKLIQHRHIFGGVQRLYYADNGYGASVVQHSASYGFNENLWELAVIKWESSPLEDNEANFLLVYDTPITDNVIGSLTKENVSEILKQIEELPA